MAGNGGAGGMPGVKKNKDMNKYANGGMIEPKAMTPPMKARGGGAAVKGLNFSD